jgi:hypothetical protein
MSRAASGRRGTCAAVMLLALALPCAAVCESSIGGTITATDLSSRPDLGAWEYILEMSWNTGSDRNLLHFSLFLDDLARGCSCSQLQTAVTPGDTVGYSLPGGRIVCEVYYYATFECAGDPALPVLGQLLRFHPYIDPACETTGMGYGTFSFFSDEPPVPISSSNLYLVDDWEEFVAEGAVSGVFPALACDPARPDRVTWGGLKSIYR